MSTTSGTRTADTSSAERPSATDATTRMSGVTSSRSSSVCLNTSLSSARITSMTASTTTPSIGLFGGEQKGIVRLAAFVHLDLELRVCRLEVLAEAVRALRSVPDQHGENVRPLAEQSLDDLPGDRVEQGAARHRLAFDKSEERALLDIESAELRRA